MDCSGLDSEDEVRLQWHWLVLQCHAELLNRALVTSGGDIVQWGTFKSDTPLIHTQTFSVDPL